MSWAQQREQICRAAQAGVRPRTSGLGSQILPLRGPGGQSAQLTRPNGALTPGRRPPSRQFDDSQPLIREGASDFILLRSGVKKLVRALAPDGNYHLTKLGKAFFKEKYTEWLAHVPVRIRGRRKNGRGYERLDYLPEHVDNRTLVETSLRQPLGALREVSYQLFKGDEILALAFERRGDKLCAARQLAELLRLLLEEVLSDFDTICDRGWQERGITPEEIRKFCVWRGAPMLFVNCQEQLLDSYQPAVKEARAVAFTAWEGHAFFYKNARVFQCDDAERLRPRFRSERRESAAPEFGNWREWDGELRAGHFCARDLLAARGALLAAGHCPKVAMRSLCEWRSLRLRAGEADCVICELPEDAEALQAWMERFGLKYCGQRLAGATSGRSARCRSSGGRSWPRRAGRLQAVRRAHRARHLRVRPRGQIQEFQALPRVPPAQDQPGEFARDRAGEPLQPRGVRDLCELPAAAAVAVGLRAAKVERGPGLLGRGCGALPQEWARQRVLPLAGVLPAGFGAGGTGGPPGRPDLR